MDHLFFLAIIVAENGSEVSICQYLWLNQQTLIISERDISIELDILSKKDAWIPFAIFGHKIGQGRFSPARCAFHISLWVAILRIVLAIPPQEVSAPCRPQSAFLCRLAQHRAAGYCSCRLSSILFTSCLFKILL